MNNLRAFGVALAVSAFVAVCVAQGPPHVTVTPENVKWGPPSPKLPPGAQVALKAVPHFNVMKGETILQFHGIGPYEIQYVNPADDPTRRSTTK